MKPSIAVFNIIGAFFVIVAVIYMFATRFTEWVGIPAFFALAAMSWMISFYLWLTDRKFKTGPSDREDGEIEDYSGTYGSFAPWSWWPLGLGVACAVIVLGVAVGWWIFFIGAALGLFFLIGWVFEFSTGEHAH
ncbi:MULTISPECIES: cytochrome c oxidase subunit 4 [Auritidibacter]|uniref:Cytochrome c oxidase polypeptide 4 n=1 Tax=Auritidibacter ignavus TaxID=678932 RepID=A0AAJ6AK92_9MICC|nr:MULTISPECIES: cytochrome c oxidase subunit 4 [Auritidibacter]NIH70603.1 hypothetical protein [Auritidibacter ignavus]PXA77839.1 cytochrome C oxidase subunit IV [Auritidibacter sp. NML100628]RMX22565.1 cytochrome c oxidase subunit 4 [Auritidibacter ignavus]WGH82172.1 cytochrome c oxidase subunit 4 [Auritidibacter ignavus]WGH84431.1 cytochrome c oxidase subunit 4 [Auritidibacter ignavus]